MLRRSFLLLCHLTKPEVEAPVSNDSSMSKYHGFARVVHSMPQLEGFDVDFDVGVEQVDDSPSNGPSECLCCMRMVHCGTKL